MLLNIAVFASGRGSNFEALCKSISEKKINARVVIVLSNNSDAGALLLARSFHIPAFHISQKQFPSTEIFTQHILDTLERYAVNVIVLAGYMKKIDAKIIQRYRNHIINIHPALLPKFGGAGMYGHFVHEAVIAANEKFSGATVHIVDEEYDKGAILLQQKIAVDANDTAETLAQKVLNIEHEILPRVIEMIAEGTITLGHL